MAAACGGEEQAKSDIEGARAFEFLAGEFELSTVSVNDDRCLGGALNLLFMPEGPATPWKWEFPVQFYPPESLPKTYDVPLRQPFGTISVKFEAVDMTRERARGLQNTGVTLNEEQFGDCVTDLEADLGIVLISSTEIEGEGVITLSNPRSALGDGGRCPRMADPCELDLVFKGRRL